MVELRRVHKIPRETGQAENKGTWFRSQPRNLDHIINQLRVGKMCTITLSETQKTPPELPTRSTYKEGVLTLENGWPIDNGKKRADPILISTGLCPVHWKPWDDPVLPSALKA